MEKNNTKKASFLQAVYVIVLALIGCASVVFAVLYIDTFKNGAFLEYKSVFVAVSIGLISVCTVLSIMFYREKKEFVYKLFLLVNALILSATLILYFLKISGFFEKIRTIEEFRSYISSFGAYAAVLFIVIQFLQVVILPIPAFITVGAGVLLFGPLKGAIYSFIGIISGSMLAFYLGKIFGYKIAIWMVGKESLERGLKIIKGKDKIVLTFMFLFPFFPDDVLCFVAGVTTVTSGFFISMIFITRIISVFCSSFSMNNDIIPYDTWWGILLWIVFFVFTIIATILIYKKGDKIEEFFNRRKIRKNKAK